MTKPIFPIWVEAETDLGSKCRDYNTLHFAFVFSASENFFLRLT
jgi:hypothetical protein